MKKNLVSAILIFIACFSANAQDKIITLDKDTINCKISKVTHKDIFFEITTSGITTSGKLPVDSISDYTIHAETRNTKETGKSSEPYYRLRFGATGGMGYLLASSADAEDQMKAMGFDPDKVESYYSDLKSGLFANADISYFFNQEFGAGLKYKFFDTNGSIEGYIDPHDGVNLYYTTFKEQVYVNYAGAAFIYQDFINSKKSLKLNSSYSVGLAYYRDEAEVMDQYFLLKGKNIGFDISVGLEYFITPDISVGTDLSVFYSKIQKMTLSNGSTSTSMDLEKENYENLSRLELSIGVRFYLWKK
jgi:hypothetical protein